MGTDLFQLPQGWGPISPHVHGSLSTHSSEGWTSLLPLRTPPARGARGQRSPQTRPREARRKALRKGEGGGEGAAGRRRAGGRGKVAEGRAGGVGTAASVY